MISNHLFMAFLTHLAHLRSARVSVQIEQALIHSNSITVLASLSDNLKASVIDLPKGKVWIVFFEGVKQLRA